MSLMCFGFLKGVAMKILIVGIFVLLSTISYAKDLPPWMKQSGWVSFEELCRANNELKGTDTDCSTASAVVTGKSSMSPWAGETTEYYFDKDSNSFTQLKIMITWTSNKSPYDCKDIIMVKPNEVRDFTHRSLAMSECP